MFSINTFIFIFYEANPNIILQFYCGFSKMFKNLQDVMLCGGSDAAIIPPGTFLSCVTLSSSCINLAWQEFGLFILIILGAGLGGFVACRALSQRNEDPSKASRPWDTVMFLQSFCLYAVIKTLFLEKYISNLLIYYML